MPIDATVLTYLESIGSRFPKQMQKQHLTQTEVAQYLSELWHVKPDTAFEYLSRVNSGAIFAKLHPANAPKHNNGTRTPDHKHEQRVAEYAAAVGVADLEKFLQGLERELPQFTYKKATIDSLVRK